MHVLERSGPQCHPHRELFLLICYYVCLVDLPAHCFLYISEVHVSECRECSSKKELIFGPEDVERGYFGRSHLS